MHRLTIVWGKGIRGTGNMLRKQQLVQELAEKGEDELGVDVSSVTSCRNNLLLVHCQITVSKE